MTTSQRPRDYLPNPRPFQEPMRTLTLQELYDLVWSAPMKNLAESFGISDADLSKI
jgi:hypothetical protein